MEKGNRGEIVPYGGHKVGARTIGKAGRADGGWQIWLMMPYGMMEHRAVRKGRDAVQDMHFVMWKVDGVRTEEECSVMQS